MDFSNGLELLEAARFGGVEIQANEGGGRAVFGEMAQEFPT